MRTTVEILLTAWAFISIAAIVLLISRNKSYQDSEKEWENACQNLQSAASSWMQDAIDWKKTAESLTKRYKEKDKECENMRASKSAINARYEELIMSVTTVGLDRNARHDTALNYIIRGNTDASSKEEDRRDSLMLAAVASKPGPNIEQMSKEEIRGGVEEARINSVNAENKDPICKCGSGRSLIRLRDGTLATCCEDCIPF